MLGGVAVIPVDVPASPELVARIIKVAEPRGILVGDGLQVEPLPSSTCVWRLRDIRWIDSHWRCSLDFSWSQKRLAGH